MLVMGSFTISYMPFIIIVILNSVFNYPTGATSTVYKVSNSLAMANSAVNPLIYAWKNKEFKRTFCRIIHCKSVNGSLPEDGLSELRSRRIRSVDKSIEERNEELAGRMSSLGMNAMRTEGKNCDSLRDNVAASKI